MSILKQTNMRVEPKGQLVEMQLGNVPITMDYATALKLSQMLRVSGKRAKRNAGDLSITMNTIARLTDANVDEKESQRNRDATAGFRP